MKGKTLAFLVMLLLFSTSTGRPASPETTVCGFYSWYLHRLSVDDYSPLKNRTEALKYLTPEFLKRVPRLTRDMGADVIICAQDWDRGWEKNLLVDAAVVEGARSTTTIHLKGTEMDEVKVKVSLRRTTAGWRIDGTTCAN